MYFFTAKSIDSVHLGSSIKIFDESVPTTEKLIFVNNGVSKNNNVSENILEKDSLLGKETGSVKEINDR